MRRQEAQCDSRQGYLEIMCSSARTNRMTRTAAFVQTLCSDTFKGTCVSLTDRKPQNTIIRSGRPAVLKQPSSAVICRYRMCAQTEEKPAIDSPSSDEAKPNRPAYVTIEKSIAIAAFVGFGIVTQFLAPGSFSDSGELQKILSGNFSEVNDLFFSIFNLIGAVCMSYAAVLNPGASQQKQLSTDIFSFLGVFLGFYALGPYMVGREYTREVSRDEVEERGWVSRILESRVFGVSLLLYSLWIYAFTFGLFTPGSEQLHDVMFYGASVDLGRLLGTDRFVFATTVDTAVLSALFWGPITEDMRRRGWFRKGQETESWLTALSILSAPGLGPALYLVLRPRLPSTVETESQQ